MQEVYRGGFTNKRFKNEEKKKVRERAFEVYNYRDVDGREAKEFLDTFLDEMNKWKELKEFVYDDVHILDTLYRIAKRVGMEEQAREFKDTCYRKILEEVSEDGELRYPLQLTFILENYDHEASEKVREVLERLKPSDRNVEMIKLVLNNVIDGYDEKAVEELKDAYRKLKLEKSFGRLARVFERILRVK